MLQPRLTTLRVFAAPDNHCELAELAPMNVATATLPDVAAAIAADEVLSCCGEWAGVGMRLYAYAGHVRGRELLAPLGDLLAAAAPLHHAMAEELAGGLASEALLLADWFPTEAEAEAYARAEWPRLTTAEEDLQRHLEEIEAELAAAVQLCSATDAASDEGVSGDRQRFLERVATRSPSPARDLSSVEEAISKSLRDDGSGSANGEDSRLSPDSNTRSFDIIGKDWGRLRALELSVASLRMRLVSACGQLAAAAELCAAVGSGDALPPSAASLEMFARRAAAADDETNESALAALSALRFLHRLGHPLGGALRSAAGHGRVRTVWALVGELGVPVDDATAEGDADDYASFCGNGGAFAVPQSPGKPSPFPHSPSGATALHCAVVGGHIDVARALVLGLGADPNACSPHGRGITPLHLAAVRGDAALMRALVVELGADVLRVDDDKMTALHHAARWGHTDAVLLFSTEPSFQPAVADGGVDANAKQTRKDRYGYSNVEVSLTPMLLAVENGHTATAMALINVLGANPAAKGSGDTTAVHLAAAKGNTETMRTFVVLLDSLEEKAGGQCIVLRCEDATGGDGGREPHPTIGHKNNSARAASSQGLTPLHLAAANGHIEAATALVAEYGADVNAKSAQGETPLVEAVRNRHVEMVRLLVRALGADVNIRDSGDETPLHSAASSGCLETVRVLVEELGADALATDVIGRTPFVSVPWNCPDAYAIRCVLTRAPAGGVSRGSDTDHTEHTDDDGGCERWNRLRNAQAVMAVCSALEGDKDGERLRRVACDLKNAAAEGDGVAAVDVNTVPWTCVSASTYEANPEMMRPFVDLITSQSPLHSAAFDGRIECVRFLVEEMGANVDFLSPPHCPHPSMAAVHYALMGNGDSGSMLRLLAGEFGANANVADGKGRTPLHTAAQYSKLEDVRYLLDECGCDVNGWCGGRPSPLLFGPTRAVGFPTPLHFAAAAGELEIVKLLIDGGADVGVVSLDSLQMHTLFEDPPPAARYALPRTALEYAAAKGHVEVVKTLASCRGAFVNPIPLSTDADGIDDANKQERVLPSHSAGPLHCAARGGHVEVVRLLASSFGADVNALDGRGRTALQCAAAVVRIEGEEGAEPKILNDDNEDKSSGDEYADDDEASRAERNLNRFTVISSLITDHGASPICTVGSSAAVRLALAMWSGFAADEAFALPLCPQDEAGAGDEGVCSMGEVHQHQQMLLFAAQNGQTEAVQWLLGVGRRLAPEDGKNVVQCACGVSETCDAEERSASADASFADCVVLRRLAATAFLHAASRGDVPTLRCAAGTLLRPAGVASITKHDVKCGAYAPVPPPEVLPATAALRLAAANGLAEAARVLIVDFDADADAPAPDGTTAISLAESGGHAAVLRVLRRAASSDVSSPPLSGDSGN